jgi:N-acetylmuramoyl-L-alanine amidase
MAFLFNNSIGFAQKKEFVVVLDAGHGGHDPGNIGIKKVKEKDIALKIVLQVGELLEKNSNIKVVYTRKTDVFVNLWERGDIANKMDADLFVSIHCNSWHTQEPNGIETYVLGLGGNEKNFAVAKAENKVILLEENYEEKYKGFDPNSPESFIGLTLMQEEYLDQSIQLASIVQENLIKEIKGKNRGVKQNRFVVLYQTYMPSILIESGFLSSPIDYRYMSSANGQEKMSNAIFNGIKTYAHQLALNSVTDEYDVVVNEPAKIVTSTSEELLKDVEFKVQIASGARKLETKSYNFKGLKNIERIKVGRSYKYYIGKTSDYSEIKELQQLAKSKGYTSAFVVAFKNGKKIPVEEVLKKS